jgi:photosystem II stability/assembly factor-like uncharacterized protein
VLLAATGNGLARAEAASGDGWSVTLPVQNRRVRSLAAATQSPNSVFAGTDQGVLRSDDRGRTWQPAGMVDRIVTALAVSPQEPQTVYAGVKPAGVYVSRDGGRSWTAAEAFQHIRGRRWWRSPAEPPDWRAYVQAISVSPADPNVIVAGVEFGAVVRSDDGGRTWSNHRRGAIRDCHGLAFHVSDGNWVYQGGASLAGAAVSRDAGVTWQQPKQGLKHHYGWTTAADPQRPEVWYLSAGPMGWTGTPQAHKDGQANAAIYRKAGGAPWERLGGGLPQPLDYMAYALVTDPADPGHLYAGLSNGQVWHTSDYGDSWAGLPLDLGRVQRMILI